jgi:hypothetical protein
MICEHCDFWGDHGTVRNGKAIDSCEILDEQPRLIKGRIKPNPHTLCPINSQRNTALWAGKGKHHE